ncbi:MAG: hypothetical protein LBM65_03400 [Oscillospiraceae bacterium]|jgi:hypothetical protein|nr:hypothetical protein [Oscillospiraceae bacterium]
MKKFAPAVALLCNVFSIGAMMFPSYVVRWGTDPMFNKIATDTYSYFSRLLIGYANFFPIITATLAITGALLLLVSIIFKKLNKAAVIITGIDVAAAVFSMLKSYSITVGGILITVMLILSFIVQLYYLRAKLRTSGKQK